MQPAARRAIGSAAILAYLVGYIVLAASLGGKLAAAPWWAQALYFAAAGVLWALPLKPLFNWMGRR